MLIGSCLNEKRVDGYLERGRDTEREMGGGGGGITTVISIKIIYIQHG